jgi:integrase
MIAINQSLREQRRPSRRFVLSKVGECLYRSECGSYFAVVKNNGRQHRKSLQTKDRAIAARKLVEFRQKLNGLAPAADHAAAPTFEEIARGWLDAISVHLKESTHSRRVDMVRYVARSFRGKPANKISRLDCEHWATRRCKQVRSRTFNSELETMKLVFNYGISHGLLLENPAAGLKRRRLDTKPVVIPSRDEFKTLIAEMRRPGHWCPASRQADTIEFLAYSGCRLGEARELRWGDVDFERGTVPVTGGVRGTKNHECRVIPLFLSLRRLLLDLKSRLKRPPRPSDRILAITDTRSGLVTASRRAGIPKYHAHTFRHFFASNAVEAGVDFMTVAGWLGHRDGGALLAKCYSHLRAEHSTEMAKRIVFDAGAGGAAQ